MRELPSELVEEAWAAYGDPRSIQKVLEISAEVSTNRVYDLLLSDQSKVIAKVSAYGSYFQFREDHLRIHRWHSLLKETRYGGFLADAFTKDGRVFTYYNGQGWAVFYNEVPKEAMMPRVLDEEEIAMLGREVATFHRACGRVARRMPPTSKSLKSDIMMLLELLKIRQWQEESHFNPDEVGFLAHQCESFLFNVERLGYEYRHKLPVLIDWNIGNFSVKREGHEFRLFSRWDYDWFRIEPRILDFYFFSRVVSTAGDRTVFSYLAETLMEDRFRIFVKAYNSVYPLSPDELALLLESYRFFILNYVIKDGEHFFREGYCQRLKQEAVAVYLPSLDDKQFNEMTDFLLH